MALNIFDDRLTPLEHAMELASSAADAFAEAGKGEASVLAGALCLAVAHGREGELCAACRNVAADLFMSDDSTAPGRLEARLLAESSNVLTADWSPEGAA